MQTHLTPVKHRSRWTIEDESGDILVGSLKTKRQAIQVIGEIESYHRYNGTDHTGQRINGFEVGARNGYFTVDEMTRGDSPGSGCHRNVAADLTRHAADDIVDLLNQTCGV